MADEVKTVEVPVSDGNGEAPTVEAVTSTEDAPWGLKADGTPYKRDPTRYRKRSARKSPTRAPAKSKADPYRDAMLGTIQILSLPIAAAATQSPVFAADLVAINMTAEPIADAFASLAAQNQAVARALDKLAEVGPYGLVFAAVVPLVMQGLVNHGVLPVGTPGTVEPAVLLGQLVDETPEDAAA